MEAIKLDIKKTPIAFEPSKGVYVEQEIERPNFAMKEGEAPPEVTVTGTRRVYEPKRVTDGRGGIKTYLVECEDDKVFNALFEIGKADFMRIRAEERGIGNDEGYRNGRASAFKEIRELSWWRRLFKKF